MEAKRRLAAVIVCGLVFTAAYKAAAGCWFSGQPRLAVECAVPYGGIVSGGWGNFVQTGEETCGHAAAAFFLSGIGFQASEASIIDEMGTAAMLSLADMERVFAGRGLKTQLLQVDPGYFKQHPLPAILHFSSRHFVVFLREENGEPEIFDPAYGQVFVPWKILLRQFSGYMLYVYQ
jgi:ABC-type bacteriocin/lantibiotic exporter with double-glycine peptidase domain